MPTYNQIEEVAKKCHEANREYCKTLGDDTQPAWETAPDWQKQSAINGVKFHILNPDAGPEASHESWMAEKLAAGWKYGAVKDPEKKEHPCIVPYNGLPPEQQKKDAIFIGIINEHRESLSEKTAPQDE
jgi:hypothetical protein